jgi:hypothetical protein
MRKSVFVSAMLALLSAQAAAQVRPADCQPVFPVSDVLQTAQSVPNDVVAEQAAPQVAAKRRFLGLPFLLPLIGGGGLIALVSHHNDHNNTVSPA